MSAILASDRAPLDISKMVPIHDRVLIKPIQDEQKTVGGILLPKSAPKGNADAHVGQVVSIGEAVDLPIQAGDVVVYQKYAMAEVEVPEGEIIFVAQKSVMAKLS